MSEQSGEIEQARADEERTATVRDYMTASPEVVGRGTSISSAAERMKQHSIRHLPVVDGQKLIGVVSERDLRLITAMRGVNADQVPVDEVMTPAPYDVAPETPLDEAAAVMARCKYGSAVITEGGKVIGILTTTDALRALVELRATHPVH